MTPSFDASKLARTSRNEDRTESTASVRAAKERRSIRTPIAALAAVATVIPLLGSPAAVGAAEPAPSALDGVFDFDDLDSLSGLIAGGDRLGASFATSSAEANNEPADTNVVAVVTTPAGLQVLELDSPAPDLLSGALFELDGVIAAEVDGASFPMGSGAPYGHLQTHLSSVRAMPNRSAGGTVVAVLDSGVEAHPDLPPMTGGYNTVDENTNTAAVTAHGTMVAGAMTAVSDNGIGIDATVNGITVMPVRVCGTQSCSFGDVAEGIIWATDNGADVINISLGGGHSSATEAAVNYANDRNVLVVASAGNNGASGNPIMYPAALPGVLGVGANTNDQPTNWASNGEWVEMSAPGESVATLGTGGNYVLGQGTSFSAPQVAAAAALLRSIDPSASNADIRSALVGTSRDIGTAGWDRHTGHGTLDITAAVATMEADRGQFGSAKAPNTIGAATSIDALVRASDYRAGDATTLRLYRAFLGREPDVVGAQYWIGQSRSGASLGTIIESFANSAEFTGRYGSNVSNDAFLNVLYDNVLGRGSDPAGYAYWLGLMNNGTSRTDVVYNVAANTEFTQRYPYGA